MVFHFADEKDDARQIGTIHSLLSLKKRKRKEKKKKSDKKTKKWKVKQSGKKGNGKKRNEKPKKKKKERNVSKHIYILVSNWCPRIIFIDESFCPLLDISRARAWLLFVYICTKWIHIGTIDEEQSDVKLRGIARVALLGF